MLTSLLTVFCYAVQACEVEVEEMVVRMRRRAGCMWCSGYKRLPSSSGNGPDKVSTLVCEEEHWLTYSRPTTLLHFRYTSTLQLLHVIRTLTKPCHKSQTGRWWGACHDDSCTCTIALNVWWDTDVCKAIQSNEQHSVSWGMMVLSATKIGVVGCRGGVGVVFWGGSGVMMQSQCSLCTSDSSA